MFPLRQDWRQMSVTQSGQKFAHRIEAAFST